jgi:hypothetical protein
VSSGDEKELREKAGSSAGEKLQPSADRERTNLCWAGRTVIQLERKKQTTVGEVNTSG